MEEYIVLDIESPNTLTRSISSIGIVRVKNNEQIDSIYSLINPDDFFEPEIISLTGISPEMVKDAPKFNEFWSNIEDLLLNYPIIGHNINYDLTVISRTLERYGIKVPTFEYICTLKLSKRYLKLNSYALTYIMDELNVEYDAHNALADAEVTFKLFKYLETFQKQNILDTHRFYLKSDEKKEINEDITPNLNELYGLLLELRYKEEIRDNHLNLLKEWIQNNSENKNYEEIPKIIKKLDYILNNELTEKDMNKLSTIVSFVSKSEIYSKEELNYQILNGILEMIKCDEKISPKEYDFLEKWLNYYELPENVDKEEILSMFIE